MHRILLVFFALVALTNLIESFIGRYDNKIVFFLGFGINIWVYRIFWTLIFLSLIYIYFRQKNIEI